MKTRAILLLMFAVLLPATSFGQIRLGLRGGINISHMKTSEETIMTTDYKIIYPDCRMLGYHVGLIGQIQLFNLFLQPEALYTLTRNDIKVYDLSSATPDQGKSITQNVNRLDIPILLGIKRGVLKICAGPVITFVISDDSDLHEITKYDIQMNKATVGFQGCIGLDIKKIAIDLKYEGNLSKLGNGIDLGKGNEMKFDTRVSQVILSIGLFF
jgi:hypothetical protein